MATKSEITEREAIKHILTRVDEGGEPPFTVYFSEIVRIAATRNEQIYPTTLGRVADNVCSELRTKRITVERRRPPNACFFVVKYKR